LSSEEKCKKLGTEFFLKGISESKEKQIAESKTFDHQQQESHFNSKKI